MQANTRWMILIGIYIVSACTTQTSPTLSPTGTAAPSPTSVLTSTVVPTRTARPTSTPRVRAVVITTRPPGSPVPFKIIGPVGYDYKSLSIPQSLWFERVAWVADVRVDYGGGIAILSGAPNEIRPLNVDDVLTIKVLHEDGTSDTFKHDFSADFADGPQEAGPFDLSPFFRPGLNMLYVTIYDNGYSAWGTSGVWIVEFR